MVSHDAAVRYLEREKKDQVPSRTWSFFVDRETSQHRCPLPRMRVDKEYSASKFHSLTHELKTEV